MSVTRDIVTSWHSPRVVIRRHLARPVSEPFAFTLLLTFLILAFVAQWPVLSRLSYLDAARPLLPQMLATALALLATIPLWYAVAAISRIVARFLGGQGTGHRARLALFMALVAVSPMVLLHGMVQGFLGPGPQATLVGALAGLAFVVIWMIMLVEAERP
ncbi:MAG: YIP1 family protein [Rhodobacteraceae bacterium]|nr:YIP1 family protein [Paracoccaceae bacterium]